MIGNSGIDQDVQAKMDAYRGNPKGLEQKYAQNKQLIDLLALQQLKSEKEAAVREMQMKMGGQQTPTVGDKLEGEVLDLTKQELAQQTTGTMQQQQAQQQQAAKQMVQEQAKQAAPMMQGVAGLQAPNMSPKAMAAGGIVAFQSGGEPEYEEFQQLEERPRPEASARPSGESLAQRGIRTLIGDRTPREIFEERRIMAQQAMDYTPAERAIMERQLAEKTAMDAARYNADRRRSEGLTRWLLGAGGRTGIGSVLGGAGASAVNYREDMDAQERNALVDRQKQEAGLVNVGPASRAAGMKYGTESEKNAIYGMAQGTGDAVRLEQIQAAAARAGISPDDKRITQAYQALNMNPEIRALIKTREASGRSVDDPENVTINRRIYAIAEPIFRGRGLDPSLFIPAPPEASEAPAAQPGFWSMVGNALTPSFGGGSSSPPPRRAPSGGVDYSNPRLRDN